MESTGHRSERDGPDRATPADVARLAQRLRAAESARGSTKMEIEGAGLGIVIAYPQEIRFLFQHELARPVWLRTDYVPEVDADDLKRPERASQADMEKLARMLTAAHRGERFCDGWWLTVLDRQWLWPIVQRLRQLVDGGADEGSERCGADDA